MVIMKKTALIFAVLLVTLFVSCTSRGASESVSLEGSEWVLTAFTENAGITVIQNDDRFKNLAQKPEINFGQISKDSEAPGVFSGTTGVNRLTASYTLDTGTKALKISQTAITRMMALSQDAALLEGAFTDLLQQVSSYSIKGNELTLLGVGKVPLLVFVLRGH
jgi:heat shock protein HslJ